ncbi:MAG: WYL domain-containing protein [bacterium]|nr:WYL domain-containing protein [bacterium]
MASESQLKPEQFRLERLLRLIAALINSPRFLSIAELQTQVGITKNKYSAGYPADFASARRAFHRDMNELKALGIPVISGKINELEKDTWGYLIRKQDYALPEMDFESDELAALHQACTAVRFHGISGAEALWKLGGQVGEATPTELATVPIDPCLAELFRAVTEQRVLRFNYSGQLRSVEPWTLAFEQGHWYLMGYDHTRRDKRTFRVDRIEEPSQNQAATKATPKVELGYPGGFELTADIPGWSPIQPWKLGDQPEVTAHLWVTSTHAPTASRRLGQTPDAYNHDGSVIFEVPVRNPVAFRSVVLEFLDQAEILRPKELRDDMVWWLQEIAK